VGVPARAEILVGVNDRHQLMEAEAIMHAQIARTWGVAGATIKPGARIDDAVVLEEDVTNRDRGSCCAGRPASSVAQSSTWARW